MIKIQPKLAGYPQELATQILIRPIINSTTDKTCSSYFQLFSESGKQLADGNLDLSEEEYDQWGADNSDFDNIILGKLNLERL